MCSTCAEAANTYGTPVDTYGDAYAYPNDCRCAAGTAWASSDTTDTNGFTKDKSVWLKAGGSQTDFEIYHMCRPCPRGYYCPFSNQLAYLHQAYMCPGYPDLANTLGTGSTSDTDCMCQPWAYGSESCTECPAASGRLTLARGTTIADCKCNAGYYALPAARAAPHAPRTPTRSASRSTVTLVSV